MALWNIVEEIGMGWLAIWGAITGTFSLWWHYKVWKKTLAHIRIIRTFATLRPIGKTYALSVRIELHNVGEKVASITDVNLYTPKRRWFGGKKGKINLDLDGVRKSSFGFPIVAEPHEKVQFDYSPLFGSKVKRGDYILFEVVHTAKKKPDKFWFHATQTD